jgi:hypothetical protein
MSNRRIESTCGNNEQNTTIIHAMNSAKHALEGVDEENRPEEYKAVLAKISAFIVRHCEHHIVRDYIDVSVEKTIMIEYCTKCLKTYT